MNDNKEKFYVMLEKEWFYNGEEESLLEKYDSDSLMVYSILMKSINTRNCFNFTLTGLYKILHIPNTNTTMINKVKNVFKKLNDNLFAVYEDSSCNISANVNKLDNNITYYAKRLGEPIKDKFFMVYDEELDTLIKYASENKKSREDLIAHFCFITNGFNNSKDKEEYLTYYGKLETIANKTLLSESTLINNNRIFVELKLLLIDNAGANFEEDKYKNTSNIYARVENKEQFDTYLEIKKASVSKRYDKLATKAKQDEQRRLKQLYKSYQKKNNIIDIDDLDDIQFEELHKLEMDYFNYVKLRGKELRNTNFITIKRDGTKKQHMSNDEVDDIEQSHEEDIWGSEDVKWNDDDDELNSIMYENDYSNHQDQQADAFSEYMEYKKSQEIKEDRIVVRKCAYNK